MFIAAVVAVVDTAGLSPLKPTSLESVLIEHLVFVLLGGIIEFLERF
jgi:hypothetical protein